MLRIARFSVAMVLCALLLAMVQTPVAAADGPDMSKFGYPTVAARMDLTPPQNATIAAGDQSVEIRAGTFDNPVTFELLTATPGMWQSMVQGRTVRAAFAFRVTDKTTNAILATFKQPVTYTYRGADAQSTDVILNTTAATPPMITVNGTAITFDTALHHAFGGAGVGWLVASATSGTSGAAAAATGTGGMTTAATAVTTRTTGAATGSTAAATGTGGGTAATAPVAVLPPTGQATGRASAPITPIALTIAAAMLCVGVAVRQRRVSERPPAAR